MDVVRNFLARYEQTREEEMSLEELLHFISGTDAPSPSSASKKKNNRKKNRKNKAAAAAGGGGSVTAAAMSSSPPVSDLLKQSVVLDAKKQSRSTDDEEENAEEQLDPELKRQVDGEVEEFRRRLEAAGQSSKTKLAPIFYLDSGTKNAKH